MAHYAKQAAPASELENKFGFTNHRTTDIQVYDCVYLNLCTLKPGTDLLLGKRSMGKFDAYKRCIYVYIYIVFNLLPCVPLPKLSSSGTIQ
jgi:hypothetical protein